MKPRPISILVSCSVYVCIQALLAITHVPRILRFADGLLQFSRTVARIPNEEVLLDVANSVAIATKLSFHPRKDCLPRALTLYYLLNMRGLRADLCLGVKRPPFVAHAWVEVEERPVWENLSSIASYTVIARLAPRS